MKAFWCCTFFLFYFNASAQQDATNRYEFSHPQMGTIFQIILYAPTKEKGQAAAQAAFARVDEINKVLSDYDPESELNRLSKSAGTGKAFVLSPDLWQVLKKSIQVSEKTEGAFDVTIGPIVHLWRRARRQQVLPEPTTIAAALNSCGFKNIQLNTKTKSAILLKPNMQLDMGAIGKGYAVDEAMKILKLHGVKAALVDGGGNIAVSQPPPGSKGWDIRLSIQNTSSSVGDISVNLKNQAVATSGDLYQYLELNGIRYSHIVDPKTGIGLTDQSRVTIITKTATDADWLSTSLSVLQPDKGLKLAKKLPKTHAIIVQNQNNQIVKIMTKRSETLFSGNK